MRVHEIPSVGIKGWDVPAPLGPAAFDVAVVVSFGYFIPPRIIDHFRAAINVHPSLLPRYRGASPIQYAIKKYVSCPSEMDLRVRA